jgi:hypothetical protein
MLRMESETGWWLITHPDHARLAGEFAAAWGNRMFRTPEPRARVLQAIAAHDDGWAERDAHPVITREGKPSAFSTELVGKYSAFEEIDLVDYLAVRERAVRAIAEQDAYQGLIVALHTHNLLTAHADRSTIAPEQLPLLDEFLETQREYRQLLIDCIQRDPSLKPQQKTPQAVREHFCLLQACDNLSLIACVAFNSPADSLHPIALNDDRRAWIQILPIGLRHYRLDPWPFAGQELTFQFPARHVEGKSFASSTELGAAYAAAPSQTLSVTLSQ